MRPIFTMDEIALMQRVSARTEGVANIEVETAQKLIACARTCLTNGDAVMSFAAPVAKAEGTSE